MILVTGGTGYIGSHTCVRLIEEGYEIFIVDNLSNSSEDVLEKIRKITGVRPKFRKVDIRDELALEELFDRYSFECVIHFAGLKAVGESVEKPLCYYDNNINGTISLLKVMRRHNCNNIIFSSSATVYGDPKTVPISEDAELHTTNPYGSTKLYIEQILKDICKSDSNFNAVLLRYFNPIGAHDSGLLGEMPNGIPNNLMPRIVDVALGKTEAITVFGTDYPTKDGTGVRDYIHVVDLADGHVKALQNAINKGLKIYNLGTGCGYSVNEIIDTFNRVNNLNVPKIICDRRPGDIAECYANPEKANTELKWQAVRNLENMCADSWNFAQKTLVNS